MLSLRRTVIYLLILCAGILAAFSRWLAASADEMTEQVTGAPADQKFVYAALATCILLLGLIGIRVFFTRLDRLLDRWHMPMHQALRVQRLEVVTPDQIRSAIYHSLHTLRFVSSAVVVGIYLSRILVLFPEAEPLALELQRMIRMPLEKIWQACIAYLPNLFEIVVILTVTRYLLKLVHLFFHALGMGIIVVRGFYPDWAEPTYKIVRILAVIFVGFIIMPLLPGSDSQFFEEISFFLGLLVSLGSTSAIKNMTAGMVLTYTRSFQIGDRICVNGSVGDVLEKSLFVTRIQTIKNEQIAIPNSLVLDNEIVNYATMAETEGLILHTSITIGYDVDWRQVHDLMIAAALQTEHIHEDPEPFVLQTSLDDYYVSYQVNAYTNRPDRMATIYSELHEHILDAFHSAGVEIMSPAYTALRNGNDPAIPKLRRASELPQKTPPRPSRPPQPQSQPVHLPVREHARAAR
ncbi:mechanosensitive ion channel family protein [Aggregatilinea lenta]|uniref:mechanosensitive ion channel family protein n=1 Tax=Aggregatilinea lenta TaxID=913108 RepID=UPI000E5B1720|nr:mechanosensitive ion channel domain-containing protein [Aggregatilinea lenta]